MLAHCLAFGRPVVVSPDVRGLREMVARAGCGFIANNDDGFVEDIVKILNDDSLRNDLSENARDYVKENLKLSRIKPITRIKKLFKKLKRAKRQETIKEILEKFGFVTTFIEEMGLKIKMHAEQIERIIREIARLKKRRKYKKKTNSSSTNTKNREEKRIRSTYKKTKTNTERAEIKCATKRTIATWRAEARSAA